MEIPLPDYDARHLKVLFFLTSDAPMEAGHPLWRLFLAYKEQFAEVHLVVFRKTKLKKKKKVEEVSDRLFVYYVNSHFPIMQTIRFKLLARAHLFWKEKFRPDIIISLETNFPGFLALRLARRQEKRFFVVTTGAFLDYPKFSEPFRLGYYLTRAAAKVMAIGNATAERLVESGIPRESVASIAPYIDKELLNSRLDRYDFSKKYPGHKFFILSHVNQISGNGIGTLFESFRLIHVNYPHAALIIFAAKPLVSKLRAMIKLRRFLKHVFVWQEVEDMVPYYRGGHLFVSTKEHADVNLPVLFALNLELPVITTPVGLSKELFGETSYGNFLCPPGDAYCISKGALDLIGDLRLRDQYRLNAPVLLKSLQTQTADGFVRKVVNLVESVIQ